MWHKLILLVLSLLFYSSAAIARDLPNCNATIIKWDFGVAEGYYPDATAYDVDQDNFPRGFAVDDKGNIYVGDGVHYELLKFSPAGQLVWKTPLQPPTVVKPELGYEISAVAIGPNYEILLWNRTNERIETYTQDGKFKNAFPILLHGSNQPSQDSLYVSKSGEVIACHGEWHDCLRQDRVSGEEIKVYSIDGKYLRNINQTPSDSMAIIDYIGNSNFSLNSVYDTKDGRCITIQQNDKDVFSCGGVPANRGLHHIFDPTGNLYFLLDDGIAIVKPDYSNPVILANLSNYRRDCERKLDLTDMSIETIIGLVYSRQLKYLDQEDPELRSYLLKQKPENLRLLRNAIYARLSYKFRNKKIQKYFKAHFPEYKPIHAESFLGYWDSQDLNYVREIEETVLGKGIDEVYGGAKKRPERHGASKREIVDLENTRSNKWFYRELHFPPKYYELMTGVKHILAVYSPYAGYVLLHTDNKGNDNKQGTNLWVLGLNRDTGFEFYTNKYARQDLDLDWINEFSFFVKYHDPSINEFRTDIYRRESEKWYRKSEWKIQVDQKLPELTQSTYINENEIESEATYDTDIAIITAAIAISPQNAEAYVKRGKLYLKVGDYNKAIQDFDTAIELNPHNADAYHFKGSSHRKLGHFQLAIEAYSKAIEQNPNDATVYYNRGIAFSKLGDHLSAIRDYTRAMELDDNIKGIYNNRGNAYSAIGNYSDALKDFNKAIEIDPSHAPPYAGRGHNYYRQGLFVKAINDFRNLVSLMPHYEYARIWVLLALQNGPVNEYQDGLNEFKKYIQDTPSDEWIRILSAYYTEMGTLSEQEILAKAKIGKDDQEIQERLCEAYYYFGEKRRNHNDLSGAAELFKKSIETRIYNFYEYQNAFKFLQK